jgi:hypothetical protein
MLVILTGQCSGAFEGIDFGSGTAEAVIHAQTVAL